MRSPLLLAGFFVAPLWFSAPVFAASFDCKAAGTDIENIICGNTTLSQADEVLARAYEVSLSGLSEAAEDAMRSDQRTWLASVERSCVALPAPESPISSSECLLAAFTNRISTLEQSRMLSGLRFYVSSDYEAGIDPDAKADAYWRISNHSFTMPLIDGDGPLAEGFNAAMDDHRRSWLDTDRSNSEDVSVDLRVLEATTARITVSDSLYWYGHGAAHPNHAISYIHYLVEEGRELRAEDVFSAEGWQDRLRELTAQALRDQHGETLWDDFEEEIDDLVVDPSRWLFKDRALILQFNPYEVAAYAYGDPQAAIAWNDLRPLLAEGGDAIRWGSGATLILGSSGQ